MRDAYRGLGYPILDDRAFFLISGLGPDAPIPERTRRDWLTLNKRRRALPAVREQIEKAVSVMHKYPNAQVWIYDDKMVRPHFFF